MSTFAKISRGVAVMMFATAFGCLAQTVRVTTWDMVVAAAAAGTEKTPATVIEKSAHQLKALSPDVVLLRGVTGWKMCAQLAQALKPADYRVVACSTFRDPANPAAATQVAIIAKSAAYFSWSEPWNFSPPSGGGFAFAAVQVAGHRFGFCSVEWPKGEPANSDQAAAQWLKTLESFRGWANNRLEGFVSGVFGSIPSEGEAVRLLRGAGFIDPLAGKSPLSGTLQAHLVPDPDSPSGLMFSRWPLTCDFDFRPAPIVVVAENATAAPAVEPPRTSQTAPAYQASPLWWWLCGSVALVLAVIVFMLLGIRRRLARLQTQSALIAAGSGQYNVVLSPQSVASLPSGSMPLSDTAQALRGHSARERETALRQGLLNHLAQWVKQTFVQRLISDRQKLVSEQETATKKVLAVDERLSRLEVKIQEENAQYEKQIEQLSRELLTAREENLELIRAQINLLKSEMQSTRARLMETEAVG